MLHDGLTSPTGMSVLVQNRRAAFAEALWFTSLMALTVVTALFMLVVAPIPIPVGGVAFLAVVALIFAQPRLGLYMALFFGLLGDARLMPWYPFVKNLSSPESILYINGALIFSPLELFLVITLAAWLIRGLVVRDVEFYQGPLFWPSLAFAFFLTTGVLYGQIKGGNLNIGLWEVRPMYYLPLTMILVSNLIDTRRHVMQMIWLIMIALVVEGLIGTYYYFGVLGTDLTGVERITEHSAAVHMNTFFVFMLASFLFGAMPFRRHLLPALMLPIIITYLATQRRAAFIGLGVALVLLAVLLYFENRSRFWIIAPIGLIILTTYTLAYWNSSGALGLPAQAVKSIVAPNESGADYSSNLYRIIENVNTSFTIHQVPLTGVGFGKKFFIVVPMPDISFFIWWEYIVHNSIFWVWVKTGVLGFMTMLFFIGFSISTGVRAICDATDPALKAVAATATIYLAMHFLYAYVDMSWDAQSMLYVGAMAGLVNGFGRINANNSVDKPVPGSRFRQSASI